MQRSSITFFTCALALTLGSPLHAQDMSLEFDSSRFDISQLDDEAPAANSTLDTTATSGSGRTGETRGQPRVSKTRCAFVGCEPECTIKGTRDAQGDLVYRTPASPEYAQANVERMFCSRADAKEAGYREEKQPFAPVAHLSSN